MSVHQRPVYRRGLTFLSLLLAVFLVACNEPVETDSELQRLDGKTMGTTWSVVLGSSVTEFPGLTTSGRFAEPDSESLERVYRTTDPATDPAIDRAIDIRVLKIEIEQELARLNRLMSTWDPDSELSRFNALQSIEAQPLHADTLRVIDTARRVSQVTAGRYDITLAEVISFWGFGEQRFDDEPDESRLTQLLARAGHHQLVRSGDTLRKRNPDVQLDVSSLAKGFAVDQIGRLLEGFGVDHYIAEIGGELRVRGFRRPGLRWQVGVEHPDGSVNSGLALTDAHVASSGSYRNYRELDGKRISHIIDGSTGRPIEHSLVAVTVLHDSTMLADAWATALLIVGNSRAIELSEKMNLAVQLTSRSANGFSVYRSPRFAEQVMESNS